jgi:hypothetical protein
MAKIVEEIVVIKFSKIVKNTESNTQPTVTDEQIESLAMVAGELVGDGIVIEIERA